MYRGLWNMDHASFFTEATFIEIGVYTPVRVTSRRHSWPQERPLLKLSAKIPNFVFFLIAEKENVMYYRSCLFWIVTPADFTRRLKSSNHLVILSLPLDVKKSIDRSIISLKAWRALKTKERDLKINLTSSRFSLWRVLVYSYRIHIPLNMQTSGKYHF